MRRLVGLAALIIVATVPAVGSAQVFVGLRAAYALPWGDAMTTWKMKDTAKSEIPVQLDLGLKLGPALAVGAYAAYGVVQPSSSWKSNCDATGSKCSAADVRLGVQVNLHAVNSETTEFWGGIAAGYEELRVKNTLGMVPPEATFKGYDATIQGGIDFLTSPTFRIGPFASATAGQFTRLKGTTEFDITGKELHGWLQLGLRGMFAN